MTTAITGATIIDGTGRDPQSNMTVIIEGERIQAVQRDGDLPRGAEIIDGAGLTLLPGLIDAHVHLTMRPMGLAERLMTPSSLALASAVPHALATLHAGITTARDAGGTPAGIKYAIERGYFPGPRLKVAISILSQTGGHADGMMPMGCMVRHTLPDVPPSVVDGVEPMQLRARELLRAGADWIKLCTTGGVLSPTDSPRASQFTIAEIAAAVAEGQAHGGTPVMAHAQGTEGIKNAIRAGVKSIEHGIWLDDEAIALMLANDVYLVPTLVAPLQVLRRAEREPGSMPEYGVRKSRLVIGDHQASFRRAVAAGVKIAMGTDSGVGPHGENAEELALMVAHGMTPMQAIVASTSSGAALLGLAGDLGTVEAGKLADLVLVAGDPLADITILQRPVQIALVMQAGRVAKDGLAAARE